MTKASNQIITEFFDHARGYNPMHGFGSDAGSETANDTLRNLRLLKEQYPELKAIDKAFFNYWYKGDEKPKIEDFIK